jgi:Leucine-rich repeat (LRR) protein
VLSEKMTECTFDDGFHGYTCTISEQKNIADPITLKGEHVSGRTNRDVQRLYIISCDFVMFPKNLHVLFPNLKYLIIQNCHLEHIGTEHIGKLKKLTHVWVTNCKLRRLEGDLFSGLEELDLVNLSGNQIEEIEPEIIDDIKRISSVNFRNNTNINEWYCRDETGSCRLVDLILEIRVKCKPLDRNPVVQKKSQELQRDMETLHNENATLKQTLQDHQEASKVMEEKFMAEINSLKLAQQNQNTLLDEHKKTIEELREKNASLSEQLVLSCEALKDIAINVGDSIFKVNEAMFMTRSSVIADLLNNNPETNELTLKDVKESTCKAVHDFINTGQLPDTADHLEVFTAAAKLKMDDLKKEAAAYLLANMDESNCFEVLVMSNKFEHHQLQQKAFEIIRTKIFPDRKLSDELMKQPEKLRSIIMAKRRMEEELNNL